VKVMSGAKDPWLMSSGVKMFKDRGV
jgi:hypothetical protein